MSRGKDDTIDSLAAAFVNQQRNGDPPTIEEFAADHPEYETDIRELFPVLLAIEQVAVTPQKNAIAVPNHVGTHLGAYRIDKQIGCGGMGIVYEAWHEGLGRRVALKVLPNTVAKDGLALARFRREAQAAAHLQHPHIVPVFEVGEDQGLHFYTMQFVEGESLDEVLFDLNPSCTTTASSTSSAVMPDGSRVSSASASEPGYWKAVARVAIQVAEALAHAHSHGVIHRDVKPSNILLDNKGSAWVTDFGLARLEGTNLTRPGSLLGTLRYMSPEQLRGWADPRSDVYGLGLTLYELLTLRPAFSSSDRGALTHQILNEEPLPPRKVKPTMPSDLETIVLKAIEKEPGRRYQSATDMAEDLHRYVELKPILARRTTAAGRLVSWSRRNPLLAASLAAIGMLLVLLGVGSFGVAVSVSKANERLNVQLFETLVREAKASRWSHRPGQRFDTLRAVAQAVEVVGSVPHEHGDILGLRNQAIASLAMADVQLVKSFELGLNHQPGLDSRLELVAESNAVGQITVQHIDAGTVLQELPAQGFQAYRILFSPDDRYVAAAYSDPFDTQLANGKLWDLTTGESILESEVRGWSFAFSPDSSMVAFARQDGQVTVFDIASRSQAGQIGTGLPRPGVAFQPNSKHLAVYSPEHPPIRLYELPALDTYDALPIEERAPKLAAWSSDGNFLAVGCRNRRTHIWNTRQGKRHLVLQGHESALNAIHFSPIRNQLATCSDDGKLILRDPIGGQTRISFAPGVFCRFSGDGRLLATRNYRTVNIHRVAYGLEFRQLAGHRGKIWCLDPDAERRLFLSAGMDGVRLWDLASMREIAHLPVGESRTAVFTPDGEAIIVAGQSRLRKWPIRVRDNIVRVGPPELLATSSAPPDLFRASVSRKASTLAFVAKRQRVHCLDLSNPQEQSPLGADMQESEFRFVAVSVDGQYIAAAGTANLGVYVFDGYTGALLKHLPHRGGYVEVRFSQDGQWLATSFRGGYRFWEVGSWKLRHRLSREAGVHGPVTWTQDGRMVAVLESREVIRLYETQSFEPLAVLECPVPHPITALSFAPDGSNLFAAAGELIQCWDLGRIRRQLRTLDLDWAAPLPPQENPRSGPLRCEVVIAP